MGYPPHTGMANLLESTKVFYLLRQMFGVAGLKNSKTKNIKCLKQDKWSRGSTVGVVTRLRAGLSGVRVPIRKTEASPLQNVETGSEAHKNFYSIGT